jgi:alkylated DNA repair protein (DNA oxidative demethylase)
MFVQGCGGKGTADLNKKRLYPGCDLFPQLFDRAEQALLLDEIRAVMADAPLFKPQMPRTGKPFSVEMTNCGPLGWVSDKDGGYRYQATHPFTGRPWPPIPARLLALWAAVGDFPNPPQACLVNYYAGRAKLGLHRDEDERDFSAPILSVSLGDTGIFRIGGLKRRDPTMSVELRSGDVVVMGGESRLRYHGINRIHPGTSELLPEGGRINLTLRYVGNST